MGPQPPQFEFRFWEDNYLSNEAIRDFSFEASDWQWVMRAFQDPKVRQHRECLALLDAGVNVGDWAIPTTASLLTVAYFGIEGSPPTAAISSANVLAVIHHQMHRENITHLAPRVLLPFPLMSRHSFDEAEKNGGVCFGQVDSNIGGQGIRGIIRMLRCDARSTAGAAYFPPVLRDLAARFQPSCAAAGDPAAGAEDDRRWPSIYVAKFDIQGFEFQLLSPAVAWLETSALLHDARVREEQATDLRAHGAPCGRGQVQLPVEELVVPGSGSVRAAPLGVALEQGKRRNTVDRVRTGHEGQG